MSFPSLERGKKIFYLFPVGFVWSHAHLDYQLPSVVNITALAQDDGEYIESFELHGDWGSYVRDQVFLALSNSAGR